MKILTMEQGSPEWIKARLGIPTASRFDSLLTPAKRKPAVARHDLRAELWAEYILGQPLEDWGSGFADRGTDMEPEARRWYEMQNDVDVQTVGFILRDDGLVGGSPDGLVGLDGGLEIKCPGAKKHARYVLGIDDLATAHVGQVQGLMYLTDREWWDVLSYNPELPKVVRRVPRDEKYLDALAPVLSEFVAQLEEDKAAYKSERVVRPWDDEIQKEMEAQG